MTTRKPRLTREEGIRQIEKHYRLSPVQRGWTTAALRIVLESYEEQGA